MDLWYKNAIIYLLPDGWQLEAGFAEKLEQAAFTPCMGLDWFTAKSITSTHGLKPVKEL